ncbi:hypothetical protein ABZ172_10860 [Streptomyces sp. NPDC006296]|uniref:hypothetical protein n=1 Tax=Streptomyces sp. NPDC006296 TaxID=3156746 RepID=UPI00339F513B
MLRHRFDHDVLVITVVDDPGVTGRAGLAADIMDLVQVHRHAPVLLVVDGAAATPATVSAVLRVHRQCGDLETPLSVATRDAATRRLLEANTDARGPRLVFDDPAEAATGTDYAPAA